MKKLLGLLLAVIIVSCAAAVSVSSAGTIYMDADFSSDGTFAQTFYPEGFSAMDGFAVGYNEAKALQTIGRWATYDVVFDIHLEEDEFVEPGSDRSVSFIYFSDNLINLGLSEDRVTISACFDIVKDEISLVYGDFVRSDTTTDLVAPVPFVMDDGNSYNFGVSVTEGRIRVFSGSTILIDYVDTNNQYHIGETIEGFEPDILVWWNNNNCLMFSDVKVASPEYLYPAMPAVTDPVTPGADATTTATSQVVVTDDEGNEVTDASGNKVTENVVITDAPVADTNNNAPQGGNSTTTGDASFVVVAAMVAAVGCALIVRKVNG